MTSYEEVYAYLEHKVDALKTDKTGDERSTIAEVFDVQTLETLYEFMTSGMVERVGFPISTGKEGNVFYAEDPDGEPMALKIFRTSTSTFKRVNKYIEGDPRFGDVKGNRRKLIYAWTRKEYSNLNRYWDAGIPVPEPIAFKKNCLLMEYIGDENSPAPQLKNCAFEDVDEVYDEVISFAIDGFRDARLVHGDLSEYNVLMFDGEPILIDCGQAVTSDHFNAKDFLRRDVENVNRFFRNRGADIISTDVIIEEALSKEEEEE